VRRAVPYIERAGSRGGVRAAHYPLRQFVRLGRRSTALFINACNHERIWLRIGIPDKQEINGQN
jgi:hypothetical protein